jgi:hypothetical protein
MVSTPEFPRRLHAFAEKLELVESAAVTLASIGAIRPGIPLA